MLSHGTRSAVTGRGNAPPPPGKPRLPVAKYGGVVISSRGVRYSTADLRTDLQFARGFSIV